MKIKLAMMLKRRKEQGGGELKFHQSLFFPPRQNLTFDEEGSIKSNLHQVSIVSLVSMS